MGPLWPRFYFSPSVVEDENPVRPTQPRSGMLVTERRWREGNPTLSANTAESAATI